MTKADCLLLEKIAERAMIERDFLPHPPPRAIAEAEAQKPVTSAGGARDLTALPWTSIDNPESRDLDQIEAVEPVDGGVKLYVGIADVEHCVPLGSANDVFSGHNTTSVYTGVRTFPMLPERFSFDLTSLMAGQRRLAVVIETLITPEGEVKPGGIYPALVENKAKLDYPSVSAWLDGKAAPPAALAKDPTLAKQVQLQDGIARSLVAARKKAGSLDIDTEETRLVTDENGVVTALAADRQDRAGSLIEELMIASNTALAKALDARGQPSIRRVVKAPERWARIVAYAGAFGVTLPPAPNSLELSRFVDKMHSEKPERFAEISLALVKMIGRGEYAAHQPGAPEIGHFALAAAAYAHATAPNRRYVDLVNQRIVKKTHAYSLAELQAVAARCTQQGAQADKVERQVKKSAAAMMLKPRLGQSFQGIITGAGPKGTYVRIEELPVEGRIIAGEKGLEVGDKVRVTLRSVNVEMGFIDFQAA